MPKATQFSDWMWNMTSTLYKETSFDGFTPFRYMVREGDRHEEHTYLAQDIKFADCRKVVSSLEGNNFDEDNWILYTSLRVTAANGGLSYCGNDRTKKNGQEVWKRLLKCYYGQINEIINIESNINCLSSFKEEAGLNYKNILVNTEKYFKI